MDKISQQFAYRIRQKLQQHLKKLILFGSHARNDFSEGSDYDMLIVVDKRNRTVKNLVVDASVEIMDEYDALIGSCICDEEEWEHQQYFPIGLNILKEGIEL